MKKNKFILFLFLIFFIAKINLVAESIFKIPEITSSTFLTQDLSKSDASIEIYTAKDIELLGISSIPELLKFFTGINIFYINETTYNISMREFPSILRINPIILIDGMEISENMYDRTYLFCLPVDIKDIERVEVIKNSTKPVNGYDTISGLINIVTKSPEELNNNYLYQEFGSNSYKKTSFSLNKYLLKSYIKFNGYYKKVNGSGDRIHDPNNIFLNFQLIKYFSSSKLMVKSSFSKAGINFFENIIVGVNHIPASVFFNNQIKNLRFYNLLINYKIKGLDLSFYHQTYNGKSFVFNPKKVGYHYFNNHSFKFSLKKNFNLWNNNFLVGADVRRRYSYLETAKSATRDSLNFYIQDSFNISKYFTFESFINSDITENLGNKISYKLGIEYHNRSRDFSLRLGYRKSFKKPFFFYQYIDFSFLANDNTFSLLKKFNIPFVTINYYHNKKISSYQLKTTEFSLYKKIGQFNINSTFFYTLLYDVPVSLGTLNFLNNTISVNTLNKLDFAMHGVDAKIEYKFKNHKFFMSFFTQKIKNKNYNVEKNFMIPKYKFSSGILFNFNEFKGGVTGTYYPSIKCYKGNSDYYLDLNTHLTKSFLKNRLNISLYLSNIFRDYHRECPCGKRIGRNIIFRVKYDF